MNEDHPLPQGRFTGPADFQRLVRQAFELAPMRGWPEMRLADPDFLHWPLGEREVIDSLTRWMQFGGTLHMMAADFKGLAAYAPRFVPRRQVFDHRFEARTWPPTGLGEAALLLWTPEWVLVGLDAASCTVVATADPARRAQLRQAWDSVWQAATVAFPATVLGL
ncbi:hypothetical protein [Tepidicella baoligensis]|uniref:hypothetical protein n=1 Tax=Tepidicella baoligensis TaxID=2707016 RepID=UPI0015DB3A2D|nr:hypothetical protein [Tepidicella baoligensis]